MEFPTLKFTTSNLRKSKETESQSPMLANGYLRDDRKAVNEFQRHCTSVLAFHMQLENEAYLSQHPEIGALLSSYISKIQYLPKSKTQLIQDMIEYFARDSESLDAETREVLLGMSNCQFGPYQKKGQPAFYYDNYKLIEQLKNIDKNYHPSTPTSIFSSESASFQTQSSSFLSFSTSGTTIPTPEPVPTPPLTFEELMYQLVSNAIDKAFFSKFDEYAVLYDAAYTEVSKAVEEAMEITVIEIREDIAVFLKKAYDEFLNNILVKEKIAAEIAWEKRMRKKMKRTLRRSINFKGYVTPPTPVSGTISSHESYRKPPPFPCKCHPQWTYNRYEKDRFGIYLPRREQSEKNNITKAYCTINGSQPL